MLTKRKLKKTFYDAQFRTYFNQFFNFNMLEKKNFFKFNLYGLLLYLAKKVKFEKVKNSKTL